MIRKTILFCVLFSVFTASFAGEVRPTKNVILMISDGTSLSVLSASRWLKTYRNEGNKLNIDPWLCGTVTTFSSNAPIGDSAPTTSCYMTGITGQASNISVYPVADPANDLIRLNPDSAYQPLATLLEAMQIEQEKSAGLVVSCEFPHATPADCASHYYNRNDYKVLASQMAYNNLEVMFGGGTDFVTDDMKQHFKNTGTTFIQNDKNAVLNFTGNRIWGLFGPREMPYDLDRDTATVPSLAQMTSKAIEVLNKNENGFFMMVEGSKVDWAAHANDPAAILSEFLAFDQAVGAAIDFARKDGNTTVVILSDHGNSGLSIGKSNMSKSYTRMTLQDLMGSVSNYRKTAEGLEKILINTKPENIKEVFKQYTGIELTDDEMKSLKGSKNYRAESYMDATHVENMNFFITRIMNSHSNFGFTTGGHTGEEVFLAVYHPQGDRPTGNIRNKEVNDYLVRAAGLNTSLKQLTTDIFAKHADVFAGMKYNIVQEKDKPAILIVKQKRKTLEITAFSSVATLSGKPLDLGSVVVFMDKNNTFYLPKNLRMILE